MEPILKKENKIPLNNPHAEEFLQYLEIEKGRSKKTLQSYRLSLEKFFKFTGQIESSNISLELIKKYRLWLNRTEKNKQNLKKNTQNYHLIILRAFLRYLAKNDIKTLPPEKIELAKVAERQVSFLEAEEVEQLLNFNPTNNLRRLRDKAIIELLFSTGLRVSELTNLNRLDINLKKEEFSVRGKGDKVRPVFTSDKAREAIKNYLNRRIDPGQALFVSIPKNKTSPTRLTTRSVERMIKKYAIRAGIAKKITPHTLRHSFATDLLINGADIRSVQAMLGHSSITTTQIYTHVTNRQLRETHEAFHRRKNKQNPAIKTQNTET